MRAANVSELLQRVENFSLDVADVVLPFSARLAREQGWPLAFAARVGDEYKRFVFLAVAAGHPVTPSEYVDHAWHLHLLYTRSYWQHLCRDLLGQDLHHDPTLGGESEGEKFHTWYAKTLESYEKFFGHAPPTEIWPSPAERFAHAGSGRWIEQHTHFTFPRPRYLFQNLLQLLRRS